MRRKKTYKNEKKKQVQNRATVAGNWAGAVLQKAHIFDVYKQVP